MLSFSLHSFVLEAVFILHIVKKSRSVDFQLLWSKVTSNTIIIIVLIFFICPQLQYSLWE